MIKTTEKKRKGNITCPEHESKKQMKDPKLEIMDKIIKNRWGYLCIANVPAMLFKTEGMSCWERGAVDNGSSGDRRKGGFVGMVRRYR